MKENKMTEIIKRLKELKAKSTPVVGWYPHTDTVRGPWNRWFQVLNPETHRENGGHPHTLPPGSDDVEYCAAAMTHAPELIKGFQTLVGDVKSSVDMIMSWQEKHDPDFNNQGINDIKHHLMGSITDSETGNVMEHE